MHRGGRQQQRESKDFHRRGKNVNADDWLKEGLKLLEQGKYPEAEEALSKAVELNPKGFVAWAYLGLARLGLKKYAEAEESFSKAVELDSQDAAAWYNLGLDRWHQGKYAEA
ncbi:MAG: tetratricopeptide repeat protein, partial [Chloroflexota bacterium]